MTPTELLERAHSLGASLTILASAKIHISAPEPLPDALVEAMREHKAEILTLLSDKRGDGIPPPLDRPPETEMELRRLLDHLDDPVNFNRWLEGLMAHEEQ